MSAKARQKLSKAWVRELRSKDVSEVLNALKQHARVHPFLRDGGGVAALVKLMVSKSPVIVTAALDVLHDFVCAPVGSAGSVGEEGVDDSGVWTDMPPATAPNALYVLRECAAKGTVGMGADLFVSLFGGTIPTVKTKGKDNASAALEGIDVPRMVRVAVETYSGMVTAVVEAWALEAAGAAGAAALPEGAVAEDEGGESGVRPLSECFEAIAFDCTALSLLTCILQRSSDPQVDLETLSVAVQTLAVIFCAAEAHESERLCDRLVASVRESGCIPALHGVVDMTMAEGADDALRVAITAAVRALCTLSRVSALVSDVTDSGSAALFGRVLERLRAELSAEQDKARLEVRVAHTLDAVHAAVTVVSHAIRSQELVAHTDVVVSVADEAEPPVTPSEEEHKKGEEESAGPASDSACAVLESLCSVLTLPFVEHKKELFAAIAIAMRDIVGLRPALREVVGRTGSLDGLVKLLGNARCDPATRDEVETTLHRLLHSEGGAGPLGDASPSGVDLHVRQSAGVPAGSVGWTLDARAVSGDAPWIPVSHVVALAWQGRPDAKAVVAESGIGGGGVAEVKAPAPKAGEKGKGAAPVAPVVAPSPDAAGVPESVQATPSGDTRTRGSRLVGALLLGTSGADVVDSLVSAQVVIPLLRNVLSNANNGGDEAGALSLWALGDIIRRSSRGCDAVAAAFASGAAAAGLVALAFRAGAGSVDVVDASCVVGSPRAHALDVRVLALDLLERVAASACGTDAPSLRAAAGKSVTTHTLQLLAAVDCPEVKGMRPDVRVALLSLLATCLRVPGSQKAAVEHSPVGDSVPSSLPHVACPSDTADLEGGSAPQPGGPPADVTLPARWWPPDGFEPPVAAAGAILDAAGVSDVPVDEAVAAAAAAAAEESARDCGRAQSVYRALRASIVEPVLSVLSWRPPVASPRELVAAFRVVAAAVGVGARAIPLVASERDVDVLYDLVAAAYVQNGALVALLSTLDAPRRGEGPSDDAAVGASAFPRHAQAQIEDELRGLILDLIQRGEMLLPVHVDAQVDARAEQESKDDGGGEVANAEEQRHTDEHDTARWSSWAALLARPTVPAPRYGAEGVSSLQAALLACDERCAMALIAAGASPNGTTSLPVGVTPLMNALRHGLPAVAVALVEAGADVDAISGGGDPTLKLAMLVPSQRRVLAVASSREGQRPGTPADADIRDGDGAGSVTAGVTQSVVSALLSAGVDLNVSDASGDFALHWLCGGTSARVSLKSVPCTLVSRPHMQESGLCEALVSAGARLDAVNLRGRSALHEALLNGYPLDALTLLELGANPNVIDGDGNLPAHYAALAKVWSSAASGGTDALPDPGRVLCELLSCGVDRPRVIGRFEDNRRGLSKSEKYVLDIEAVLDAGLTDVVAPEAVTQRGSTVRDVLGVENAARLTVVDVLCCGVINGHVEKLETKQGPGGDIEPALQTVRARFAMLDAVLSTWGADAMSCAQHPVHLLMHSWVSVLLLPGVDATNSAVPEWFAAHEAALESLVRAGAESDTACTCGDCCTNDDVWSVVPAAFDVAIARRSGSIVQYLLSFGVVDVSARRPQGGRTALHDASFAGALDVMNELLRHGASPTAKDAREETPFDSAARGGHPDAVSLLFKAAGEECGRDCVTRALAVAADDVTRKAMQDT